MSDSTLYEALATVSGTAKAAACHLRSIVAVNRNAAARYLQIFDEAAGPNASQVPVMQFLVPATAQIAVGRDLLGDLGIAFQAGLTWGFSSTAGTFTAATAADHDLTATIV